MEVSAPVDGGRVGLVSRRSTGTRRPGRRALAAVSLALALCSMTLVGAPAAGAPTASGFALGTVNATSQQPSSCPSGFQCSAYTVSDCPGRNAKTSRSSGGTAKVIAAESSVRRSTCATVNA